MSIETEISLLEHIHSCQACKGKIASIYSGEKDPIDELEELFAIDLQEKLLNNSSMVDCPLRVNFSDADRFIEARINWRLGKLREITSNAELELKHLSGRIKEEKES